MSNEVLLASEQQIEQMVARHAHIIKQKENFMKQQRLQIGEHKRNDMLAKYIRLCSLLNLNRHLSESLKRVVVVCSKSVASIENFTYMCKGHSKYNPECTCTHEPEYVRDQHCVVADTSTEAEVRGILTDEILEQRLHVMNSISDWCGLLSYFTSREEAEVYRTITRFKNSDDSTCQQAVEYIEQCYEHIKASGVLNEEAVTLPLTLQVLVFLSPLETPGAKMLEHFFLSLNHKVQRESQLELHCLRLNSAIIDTSVVAKVRDRALCISLDALTVDPSFQRDVLHSTALLDREQGDIDHQHEATSTPRLRLRSVVKEVTKPHSLRVNSSMKSWMASCMFSVSLNVVFQDVLYFMKSQSMAFPLSVYQDLRFPAAVLDRVDALPDIPEVDVAAVVRAIRYLRMYNGKIDHLIDFRAQVFTGMPASMKQRLNLPLVLQLYACSMQRESVWKECWKLIIPGGNLNHTVMESVAKFRANNEFMADRVVRMIMEQGLAGISHKIVKETDDTM